MPSAPAPASSKPRLLRYQFATVEEARRHFHRAEALTLLFFPAPLAFRYGETVTLEVGVGALEHCAVLRGRVRFIEHGAVPGAWLEFGSTKVDAALQSAGAAARRKERRLASDLCVAIKRAGGETLLGRIEDLSGAGVRVSGVSALATDEEVSLWLFGRLGSVGSGLVRWSRNGEAGLRLLLANGSAFPKVVAEAQADRLALTEARHEESCRCSAGDRREPSLPRAFKEGARPTRSADLDWQSERRLG